MRLPIIAFTTFVLVGGVILACGPDEYPNPPATRDGTESTTSGGPASLPGQSNPNTGDDDDDDSTSSSGSSGKKDASTKDVSTVPTDPGPTSGLDANKSLSSLNQAEKKHLCDWQAAKYGGYGTKTKCDGGLTVTNPLNVYECIAEIPPSCSAKISEAEACINKTAEDLCAIVPADECKPLLDCAAAAADAGADAN